MDKKRSLHQASLYSTVPFLRKIYWYLFSFFSVTFPAEKCQVVSNSPSLFVVRLVKLNALKMFNAPFI